MVKESMDGKEEGFNGWYRIQFLSFQADAARTLHFSWLPMQTGLSITASGALKKPHQGWHAKEICTNQQLIRLSIKVKLLACISLNGPSSGSIMAAALGEP